MALDSLPSSSCVEWTGARHSAGYGLMPASSTRAHRVVYERVVGPIPPGLVLDHLCRNRVCVNPAHLEPVTHRTNLLRGDTLAAANAAKVACPQGHALDGSKSDGSRYCLTCSREYAVRKRLEVAR